MRRLVWCLVLLVVFGAVGWAQSVSESSGAAAKREAAQIRATADKLIASGSPDDVAKGAALLEKAAALEQQEANADKLAMERQKLKLDLDAAGQSHWLTALVSYIPLATTVILAGTFIFQIRKASLEEAGKRQDREIEADERKVEAAEKKEERFMDVMKEIQASEHVSTAATLINMFQEEPYKTRVLDMSVKLLLSRETMDDFQTLYMEVMNPLTYDKMPQMRRLCKSVDASYFAVSTPAWNPKTYSTDETKLSDKNRALYYLYRDEQLFLSSKLGALLRNRAATDVQLDLSQLVLREIDLSGVDLGSPNLASTNWGYVNVDGCDMSGVTAFENCQMNATAWWHAAKMSKPFLDHLVKEGTLRAAGVQHEASGWAGGVCGVCGEVAGGWEWS